MADRELYVAVSPEEAARVLRDRALPAGGREVVLTAEREGTAVAVRLPEK